MQKDIVKAISTYQDRQKAEARTKVEAVAREIGCSMAELVGTDSKPKLTPVAPKYQHPENPTVTWSGATVTEGGEPTFSAGCGTTNHYPRVKSGPLAKGRSGCSRDGVSVSTSECGRRGAKNVPRIPTFAKRTGGGSAAPDLPS